jgi:hypothetical protein
MKSQKLYIEIIFHIQFFMTIDYKNYIIPLKINKIYRKISLYVIF